MDKDCKKSCAEDDEDCEKACKDAEKQAKKDAEAAAEDEYDHCSDKCFKEPKHSFSFFEVRRNQVNPRSIIDTTMTI